MTTIFNVTDVRKNWTKVAEATTKGTVLIMQRSKIAFKLTPVIQNDVGFVLTDEQTAGVQQSRTEIKNNKAKRGTSNEVIKWLKQ